MMKYKGIIFDLDGVICSTDELHYRAWKEIAKSLNLKFDEFMNDKLRGIGREESLKIILKENNTVIDSKQIQELANKKNDIYLEMLSGYSPKDLSKEVEDTLRQIKELGYKIAIGSSSKNAKFILKQLGILNWFDAISDGTNISKTKPNPEVFEKAAEYLKLGVQQCLVVEDADVGVQAALAGGFDCAGIGVASANTKITYRLATFSDLIKFI